MKDLIIIGGGPAGVSAGVYAARKQLKTTLITETFGGQSTDSLGIENWIGTVKIAGIDLAHALKGHLEAYKADMVEVMEGERVAKLEKVEDGFKATTTGGKEALGKTVLIASGAARRKLPIEGAAEFENKGVVYCASCDGPLFAGQNVAVVGGGNAGFETALQLLAYCPSVTLIHKYADFKADPVTVQKALEHPAMHALLESSPVAVKGDKFVSGLTVKNLKTNEEQELPITGLFVEIGVLPNTDFATGLVELDAVKRVKVDARTQRAYTARQTPDRASDARRGESSDGAVQASTVTERDGTRNEADGVLAGVWAAGDCTDELYHQNNIAAGDAVKALEDIYVYLKTR